MLWQFDEQQQDVHDTENENNNACPILAAPEKVDKGRSTSDRGKEAKAIRWREGDKSYNRSQNHDTCCDHKAFWPVGAIRVRHYLTMIRRIFAFFYEQILPIRQNANESIGVMANMKSLCYMSYKM
jgi:hypothetical protein